MPASSEAQKKYFAWALHHPDQAAAEGKTPKSATPKQMRDFSMGPVVPKRKQRKFYGE